MVMLMDGNSIIELHAAKGLKYRILHRSRDSEPEPALFEGSIGEDGKAEHEIPPGYYVVIANNYVTEPVHVPNQSTRLVVNMRKA